MLRTQKEVEGRFLGTVEPNWFPSLFSLALVTREIKMSNVLCKKVTPKRVISQGSGTLSGGLRV